MNEQDYFDEDDHICMCCPTCDHDNGAIAIDDNRVLQFHCFACGTFYYAKDIPLDFQGN